MSTNTSIKEGGKARSFGPVAALMVQGDDGKYLPWVPESERQLDTKSVNKNGVYQAKRDGVYGWRSFHVNVPTDQGVTGKDPTTGQQVAVGVGLTGELTETVVPTEIRVETPPTFTGPYGDRAYIGFDGLTVAAYGEDGSKMQDVPFNELVFPVTVTDIDEVGESSARSELVDGPVPFGSVATAKYMYGEEIMEETWEAPSGGAIVTGWNPNSSNNKVALIKGAKEAFQSPDYTYTHGGKTAHYVNIGLSNFAPFFNVSPTPAVDNATSAIPPRYIWTVLYGDIQAGGQYVPVLWQRPGDGAVLETGFYIDVVDVSPNNNDGN